MRKVAILITTCLILGGVLGGCGNNTDKGNNKNTVSQINNKDSISTKEDKVIEKEEKVESKEKENIEEANNEIKEKESNSKSESEDNLVNKEDKDVGKEDNVENKEKESIEEINNDVNKKESEDKSESEDNIVNKEVEKVEKEDKVENKEKESTEEADKQIEEKENSDKSEDSNVDLSKFEVDTQENKFSSVMSGVSIKNDCIKFEFHEFTGVCAITKIDNNVTIDYESELEKGKFNILILDTEYNILKVLEANKNETINLNFSNTGEYIIKAVGDEAYKGKVKITIKDKISIA